MHQIKNLMEESSMKIEDKGSKYIPETYMVKAVSMDDDETICFGFFKGSTVYTVEDITAVTWSVNPYTICRNTGIMVDGQWLFEFDLVELKHPYNGKELGFIEFDTWDSSWKVRRSMNYTSKVELRKFSKLKIIGNVNLSKSDFQKMIEYSNEKDKNFKPEPTVECRSTQYRNKKAKEFLPR